MQQATFIKPDPQSSLPMKSVTCSKLILSVALLLLLFYNFTFFRHLTEVYPVNAKNVGFLISLAVFFGSITVLLFALACHKYTIKPVLIIIFMTSAGAAYFMDTYNVVIDDSMIDNIIKTDMAEAQDLLSFKFAVYLLLLGVLPSVVIYKLNILHLSPTKAIISRFKLIAASIITLVAMVLIFSNFYASFFREHKPLRFYTNPGYYLYSSGKYASSFFAEAHGELTPIALDAKIPPSDQDRELVILVIGETARADRFSLNGYKRETNPYLQKQNVISFTNFWSCGTSTAYSLPCIFSGFDHTQFDKASARYTENVLDILQRTGVNVLWLDNNSDSKGVATRVPHFDYKTPVNNPVCDIECRDIGMLSHLKSYIDKHPVGDIFIVMHQMGNHGPAYYKRYPKEFEKFTPVCKTNQLEECSQEEINNTYDNAILYTDYFLSKTIDFLQSIKKGFESSMIYVSDHGESLGENGIYLHGLPNMIAPDVQRHVPAIFWFGNSYDQSEINLKLLKSRVNENFTHDNIFHTLLGMMEVKTLSYDKNMDMIEHFDD